MTEYFPRDMPTDIWKEILQRHWTYLETEDGMQKLEEKKKLIGCLKEFLCIVPHDRKFFLPETALVLKKSIKEMDNFSAYKAMIGFESISQYANNLFTKPWRKEFKVIKMYSGFYQHEIKSNLVDAEKLFKAMGYRQLPNQLLVLDGPICPDQVTNVSRDGMAAYVECQIMKNILNELDSLKIQCSWSEIFNFRESHVCGPSQAVKSIVFAIQERRFRNEKQISHENCYAAIPQQLLTNCSTCYNTQARSCRQPMQPPLNGINGGNCQIHGINNMSSQIIQSQKDFQKYGIMCGMHTKPQQQQSSLLPNNICNIPNQQNHNCNHHGYSSPPQMTHSKSLEHYAEPSTTNILPNIVPRHSFDHYDCIDGGHQTCTNNYNQYNHHSYNVSGNRYPLPYQISTQLSSNQSIYGHCQSILPTQSTTASGITNNYIGGGGGGNNQKISDQQHIYNDYNCLMKNMGNGIPSQNNMDTNCIVHSRGGGNNIQSAGIQTGRSSLLYTSNEIMDLYNKNIDNNFITDNYIDDEQHIKKNNSQYEKMNDNNSRQLLMKNNVILHHENILNDSVTPIDSSNDSTISTTKSISTPQSQNKNLDGYGSFETWNYVFQNLEKNGYTKDLGERGDLLVQGLDLDSIKLNSSNNDKRKSREISTAIIQQTSNVTTGLQTPASTISAIQTHKSKDNYDYSGAGGGNIRLSKNLDKNDQQVPQVINKKIDKQITTCKANGHISTGKYKEKVSNNTTNRTSMQKSSKIIKNSINNNDNINDKSVKQRDWNCRFCTYLNQESVRICEMCSRTKDFNLDGKN